MKITGITTPSTPAAARPSSRTAPAKPAEGGPGEVQLSGVSAGLASEPPVDSARIQEIRQAIIEGRFMINSSAVADRLIESARELVATQRRG